MVMDNQTNYLPNNTSDTEESKKTATPTTILFLVFIVAILAGFSLFAYATLLRDQNNTTSSTNSWNGSANPSNSDELNEYVKRDVRQKMFRLLGYSNGFGYESYNSEDGTFILGNTYMPVKELISNSLTDSLKVYITLETTSINEKYCSYSNDKVKSDIDSTGAFDDVDFGYSTIDCISYANANTDYNDLFGEDIPKITDSIKGRFGDFTYGQNIDGYYYHIMGGRGGTSARYAVGKINSITKEGDFVKVNINAGTLWIERGSGKLYSSIDSEEVYKSYGPTNTGWDDLETDLGLTDEDYAGLKTYSFVFKKNSDDIYSFVNVE